MALGSSLRSEQAGRWPTPLKERSWVTPLPEALQEETRGRTRASYVTDRSCKAVPIHDVERYMPSNGEAMHHCRLVAYLVLDKRVRLPSLSIWNGRHDHDRYLPQFVRALCHIRTDGSLVRILDATMSPNEGLGAGL